VVTTSAQPNLSQPGQPGPIEPSFHPQLRVGNSFYMLVNTEEKAGEVLHYDDVHGDSPEYRRTVLFNIQKYK
jgi:hypothetical protein